MPNGKHRQSVQRNLIVNTTEIAKMANVSVSTVSNWKRRSDTFPEPVGTKDGKPTFDYDQVAEWLQANNKEFDDNRTRNLVWEYANLVRGKVEVTEGMALFIALLHLRKAANEYGLETQWQTLIDGGDRGSWLSYLDAIDAVEHEAGHALSNYVIAYARGLVESDSIETVRDAVSLVDTINLSKIMTAANMVIDSMGNDRQAYLGDNSSPLYRLMAEMANAWAKTCPDTNPTFYDPACGGAFVAMQVALHNPQYRFALADINSLAAVVAQARFFLQFGKNATETIVLNDLIHNDPFPDLKCNLSVVTPPMGLSASSDTGVTDPRWAYDASNGGGRRPAFPSETAFLQDCIFHLDEEGRAFVALRPSFTTGRSFANLRRRMVADGVVEAIVSLPRRQLRDTTIPIDIWVLSKVEERNHVHLIDCVSATEEVAQEGLPVYLSEPLNGYVDGKYRWMDVACAEILAEDNVSLAPDKWIKPEGMNPKNICLESTEEISGIRQGLDHIDDESNPLRDLRDSLANMKESRVFTLRELVDSNEAELIRGNTQSVGRDAVYQEDVITPQILSEGMASLTKSRDVGKREHITEPGDIVFRKLGFTHAAVDVEGGHRMSHTVLALRMKGDNWIPEFVAICLQAAWNQKDTPRNIAGQIDPLDMELPVVPLEMQRKLVEIQRAADELKHLSAAAADYATTFCNAIRFGAEEGNDPPR
ncbi:HsdM family class I SAM-dependent methyltransferase [Bifidobacterium pseudolongum]|uniref:HsdM family class I SAM-dependent methyltransferase n=1 Tax=Bifidobacterium pseudolongum TaxID=1694 RepID=UPI000C700651|nr:N-6 DNA methylase [Bifidobacterium pseudolongum]PKV02325.1 type I restriction-modification system methyltransferase subunit [Bifidobacterium pseudolongum subsp. globosum]RYQ57035.1 type I restriction-modification system methyltransferase subunit [Bifidobacterium pseudolongum subsp. globosum]RYQ59016.1 type I restriction-modification system methyltransferase subunit [Bifidobacterium pseudolongum subsp. globosum]RYQ72298.1 type I restriction-modification system methyltransferase subunit [Bifid